MHYFQNKWLAICLVVVLRATDTDGTKFKPNCRLGSLRRPEKFTPSHYNVRLELNLDSKTFAGRAQIDTTFTGGSDESQQPAGKTRGSYLSRLISCGRPASPYEPEHLCDDRIVLHVEKSIHLDQVKLLGMTANSEVKSVYNLVDSVCLDESSQLMKISLKTCPVNGKKYRIDIQYTGKIEADVVGITRQDKHLFTAKGCSTFPCFDEAHLRATIQVSVIHAHRLHASSNTEPEDVGLWDGHLAGRRRTRFQRTKPMSMGDFFLYLAN